MWSSLPLWRFRPSGTAPDVNQKRLSGTSCFWWRKSLSALPPCHRKFLSMRKPFCPRKNFLQKMMSYGMTMSFSPMRTSLWKKTNSLTRRNCSDGCCPDSLRCRSRGKKTLTKTYSLTRRNRSCGCCPASLRCRSRGKKTLTKTYSLTRRNRSCGCCPASLRTQKILNSLWKRSLHFSLKPNQSSLRMTNQSSLRMTNQNSLWKKNFWTMSGSVTTLCCSSNRRSVFPVSMNQPVMR